MRKLDAILGILIGFANGLFFFFILKQTAKNFPHAWFLILVFPIFGFLGLFIASLIGEKIPTIFQMAKFFLVGTLNTFIDLGVLNFFIWISGIAKGIFYTIFKAFSFLLATVNSYFWNKYWTFEKKGENIKGTEFLKFFTITFCGLLINVFVASLVVNMIGPRFGFSQKLWATIGAVIAAFFTFIWNFLGSKLIVFKK